MEINLPLEVYHLIFEFLNPKKLIPLRLVSRSWRTAVDLMRIKSMVIISKARFAYTFYHSNVPINITNAFDLDIFGPNEEKIRQSLTSFRLFDNLKYLQIAADISHDDKIRPYLARFQFLEQLEIEYARTETLQSISHPNLRILFIYNAHKGANLNIRCPRLRVLRIGGNYFQRFRWSRSCGLDILHPESICVLRLAFVNNTSHQFNLTAFSFLECLHCDNDLPAIELNDHPHLKEIKVINFNTRARDPEPVRHRLEALLDQKNSMKRDDLKIYFNHFRTSSNIEEINKILDYRNRNRI